MFLSKFNFSTLGRNSKKLTFSLEQKKFRLQEKHLTFYRTADQECEEFIEEINLFGNEGFVLSSSEGSYFSTVQATTFLDQIPTQCILLDQFSQRNLNTMIKKKSKEHLTEQALLGKQKFTQFFVNEMPKNSNYFSIDELRLKVNVFMFEKGTSIMLMKRLRRFIFRLLYLYQSQQDQLTAAYYACNDKKKSIILSKPDSLIYIEDLVMNMTLDQLKDIFFCGIEYIKQNLQEQRDALTDSTKDLLFYMREYARSQHTTQLFSKWSMYNASLLHKCCRTFKSAALIVDQNLVHQTVAYAKLPILPEFDLVFRSYMKPDCVNEADKLKYRQALESDNMELLEKFAIASFLIDGDLRSAALQGDDIFFGSVYKLGRDDIPIYLKLHSEYSLALHGLQNDMIRSIQGTIGHRHRVISYPQELQKVMDKRSTQKYEYNTHHLSSIKSKWAVMLAIRTQINNIISKRHKAGISQNEALQAVKHVREGNFTRDSLRDYTQLLLDANASLGSPLRFPGKLSEEFMPYIVNTEKERLSTQTSRKVVHGLELLNSGFFEGRKQMKKQFSDSEDEDAEEEEEDDEQKAKFLSKVKKMDRDSIEFQKFVLGTEGKTTEFPYDISSLSMEELLGMGFDVVGTAEIRVNDEGEIVPDGPIDENVLKELREMQKKEKQQDQSDDD